MLLKQRCGPRNVYASIEDRIFIVNIANKNNLLSSYLSAKCRGFPSWIFRWKRFNNLDQMSSPLLTALIIVYLSPIKIVPSVLVSHKNTVKYHPVSLDMRTKSIKWSSRRYHWHQKKVIWRTKKSFSMKWQIFSFEYDQLDAIFNSHLIIDKPAAEMWGQLRLMIERFVCIIIITKHNINQIH